MYEALARTVGVGFWFPRIGSYFGLIPAYASAMLRGTKTVAEQWLSGMNLGSHDRSIVHVVDDDASVRAALESLFGSVGLDTRTYGTAHDFLKSRLDDAPACIIIDVRLPDMNGLEFQTQLAEIGIQLPVVMITGHGDIPMSVRAMKRGALDFIPKPFREQDLLDAVLAAIERDRQRRTADMDLAEIRNRFGTLSAREQQVMMLVVAGKMNKQAAGDLGISEITVKIHRGAAMRKMGARSFADLVRMAGVLKPNDLKADNNTRV
jgi:FixJ family two-component response regulator